MPAFLVCPLPTRSTHDRTTRATEPAETGHVGPPAWSTDTRAPPARRATRPRPVDGASCRRRRCRACSASCRWRVDRPTDAPVDPGGRGRHGGGCISPHKGAVGCFRRRGRQITGRFQAFTAHDGVSQGICCDTPSLLRRKSRLKMPVSWHPRYSETPKTRPMPLVHLFEGICRNPLSTRSAIAMRTPGSVIFETGDPFNSTKISSPGPRLGITIPAATQRARTHQKSACNCTTTLPPGTVQE